MRRKTVNRLLTVLCVEPGAVPYEKSIDPGLESLQSEIGGYIECVYPYDDNVVLIVNEEGKINGMELNRSLCDEDGEIYDIIAGKFLVAGLSEDSFASLDEELIAKYKKLFEYPEVFVRIDGKIRSFSIIPD